MFVFPWQDKYNVGIESIDDQHKKLVELLNQLASAMAEGKGKTVMEPVLTKLIEYTIFHFNEEEKYFDQIDYPDAEAHRIEHLKLIEDVKGFKSDFDNGNTGITIDLMRFLKEWLINHIAVTDKKFGSLLNEAEINLS